MKISDYIKETRIQIAEVDSEDQKKFQTLFEELKSYLKEPCDAELYICHSLNIASNLIKSDGKKYFVLDLSTLFFYQYFGMAIQLNQWRYLEKAYYLIREYDSYYNDEIFLTILYSGILTSGECTFDDDAILYNEPTLSEKQWNRLMNLMIYFLVYHEFTHFFNERPFVNPTVEPLVKKAISSLIEGERRMFGSSNVENAVTKKGAEILKEAVCDCNAILFMIELLYPDYTLQEISDACSMVISFSYAIHLIKNHWNYSENERHMDLRASIMSVFLNLLGKVIENDDILVNEINRLDTSERRLHNFYRIVNQLMDRDERTISAIFDTENNLYYAYEYLQHLKVEITYHKPETIFWK